MTIFLHKQVLFCCILHYGVTSLDNNDSTQLPHALDFAGLMSFFSVFRNRLSVGRVRPFTPFWHRRTFVTCFVNVRRASMNRRSHRNQQQTLSSPTTVVISEPKGQSRPVVKLFSEFSGWNKRPSRTSSVCSGV